MTNRIPRWAVIVGLALVPAVAFAAMSAAPEISGYCSSLGSFLFGGGCGH